MKSKEKIVADLIEYARSEVLSYLFALAFAVAAIVGICEISRYFGLLFINVSFFLLNGIYCTAEYHKCKKALKRMQKEG